MVYDLSFGMYFLYTWSTREFEICMVVLQSADIQGFIICFAIHFLFMTIE